MSEPTVSQIVREYLVSKVAQERAGLIDKRTLIKAHFYCLAFEHDFGELPLSQCRRGDLRRWLTMHPEFCSPHTKHDAAGAIVTCFRWAAEDGLISSCPYSKPRDLPTPEPRLPITAEEVAQVLASAARFGHRQTRINFRLSLWFLWETGCRTCEMFRVTWEQYDPARGCFELRSKSTHRTGRKRLLVLPARAWKLIRFLRARLLRIEGRATGHVFLNGRGRPWNKDSFGSLFRQHADRAGIRKEITSYCLRHGFCCESLEAGVGERQLADFMGHSTTRQIAWYGRGCKSKVDYLRDAGEARRRKGSGLVGPWWLILDWLETALHFLVG